MATEVSLNEQQSTEFNYELVPTPCCRLDIDGNITQCNSLFSDLMESNKECLVKRQFLEIIDPRSQSELAKFFALLKTPHFSSYFLSNTIWISRKESSPSFPCALGFKAVVGSSGQLIAINVSLTDERVYAAQIDEIRKDKEHLKKVEKLKDEFIAVASHELRTPIQPILGFAMLAKKKVMDQEVAWDGVLREARRLQQLANDILDVSRIEAGSLKYDFRKDRINELIHSLSDAVRNDLPNETNLRVIHEQSEYEIEIEIDRSRITQVMNNLISNAVKFTEKGAITIESHAFIEEEQFEIRVIDTGRGISEEILPILFEKFATKGHANVRNNKGTGLGLYISKAIVEAHNGQISACNNENGGATFVVRLPFSQKRA